MYGSVGRCVQKVFLHLFHPGYEAAMISINGNLVYGGNGSGLNICKPPTSGLDFWSSNTTLMVIFTFYDPFHFIITDTAFMGITTAYSKLILAESHQCLGFIQSHCPEIIVWSAFYKQSSACAKRGIYRNRFIEFMDCQTASIISNKVNSHLPNLFLLLNDIVAHLRFSLLQSRPLLLAWSIISFLSDSGFSVPFRFITS